MPTSVSTPKNLDPFMRFDKISRFVTDRHRQAQGHGIYRASITSRGKTGLTLLLVLSLLLLPSLHY